MSIRLPESSEMFTPLVISRIPWASALAVHTLVMVVMRVWLMCWRCLTMLLGKKSLEWSPGTCSASALV